MSHLSVLARPRLDVGDMEGRGPLRHFYGVMGPAILAVASFLLLWPFARLDFDRHHDGYMLAQAIAVHQGASVHADVFAQYGPVTPWLQSLALFLPVGSGLALRTINVVFIAATVFLLADMGRRTPRGWPVSRAVGWWAAIAWIVLADLWLGNPMLPWSSTLAALFSVATLYFLTRSIGSAEDGHTRAASIAGFTGGVFLGVMPFTRINVGLSAMAVCLVVAVLMFMTQRSSKGALAKSFVLGALSSAAAVVLVLFWTNSLADFSYQAVMWPLTWGRKATGKWHTQAVLTRTFLQQAFPVALVCGALLLQSRARTVQRRWPVSSSGVNTFTVFAGVVVVFWENFRIFWSVRRSSWESMISGLYSYLLTPNPEYLNFFMVLSVVGAVGTCLIAVFRYIFRERSSQKLAPWLLLGGLTLSGLTQIIPTWDPKHVWWAAPVGLLLMFSVVGKTSRLHRPTGNPLILALLGTLTMAILSGSAYLGMERVPGPPGTIIDGMRLSSSQLNQINQDTTFLGQQLKGVKPVIYLAKDGDLSILDGTYRSADAYFVEWGGSPQVQTRTAHGDPIVVQRSVFADGKIRDLARSLKYQVVARNLRLIVLKPLNSPAR